MKVLIFISSLRCGGAECVTAQLANALAELGDEVVVATWSGPELRPFFPLDARVRHLALGIMRESPTALHSLLRLPLRLGRIRRVIRQEAPDAVISLMVGTNVYTLLASLGLGVGVTVSEVAVPADRRGHLSDLMSRFLYPLAAGVVTPTEAVAGYFRAWGLKRVRAIPNPLRTSSTMDRAVADQPGSCRLVAAGRLSPEKGFDQLLRALPQITARIPNCALTIYGEGGEKTRLEALAQELGVLERVTFAGLVPDLISALQGGDIFVMPSRSEGFSNVLLEAMAAGVPVVSFDCPVGPREIISSADHGVLVPPADCAALAEAVCALWEDPQRRVRLAQQARKGLMRYQPLAVASQWRDFVLAPSQAGIRSAA